MRAPEVLTRIGRTAVVAILAAALVIVTWCFGREFLAGVEQMRGKGCFFRNDVSGALEHYAEARRFGGDGLQLDTDEVEAIFFGVDQADLGFKNPLPIAPEVAIEQAADGVRGLLRHAPYRAYFWSVASDLYMRRARMRRRTMPLDLSQLSESPLDNLLPETWLAIVTMQHAARLEPNNYLYEDLLVEAFIDAGSPEAAAEHCRRAVMALPRYDAHEYLVRPNVAPELLEAALDGFKEALSRVSLMGRTTIELSLADFLMRNAQYDRAIPHLLSALESAPNSFDAHFFLGEAQIQLGHYEEALEHLKIAARLLPTEPWTYYHMAKAYEALGDLDNAVQAMEGARIGSPHGIEFFHALGELLEKAHRIPDAERQFVAGASYNPGNPYAWSMLVDFYVRHDDRRAARKACDQLLALRPGDAAYQSQCSPGGEANR